MQSTNWTPEHSEALRELLAGGLSYSLIAEALNARFNTDYSRNAAIGRAKRMGLASPARDGDTPGTTARPRQPRIHKIREPAAPRIRRRMPKFETTGNAGLRCVEIVPRHLSLIDLERGDCRYPYGGDEAGEAITFCGHPRRAGSSYCTPHFHLTRGPGTVSERAADRVLLRIVEAA